MFVFLDLPDFMDALGDDLDVVAVAATASLRQGPSIVASSLKEAATEAANKAGGLSCYPAILKFSHRMIP